MKTKFRYQVSLIIKSNRLLSYEDALNVYESLCIKANRGDMDSKEKLDKIEI